MDLKKKINLNKITTYLSILCIIDCTIIPLMFILLSIFNILNNKIEYFHELSELLSLYIMLPITSACIVMNHFQIKNIFLFLFGIIGIILFTITHGHFKIFEGSINNFIETYHMPLSLLSVIIILSNNYISQQMLKRRNQHCCFFHHDNKNTKEDIVLKPIDSNEPNNLRHNNEKAKYSKGPYYHDKNKIESELVCILNNT